MRAARHICGRWARDRRDRRAFGGVMVSAGLVRKKSDTGWAYCPAALAFIFFSFPFINLGGNSKPFDKSLGPDVRRSTAACADQAGVRWEAGDESPSRR